MDVAFMQHVDKDALFRIITVLQCSCLNIPLE